MPWLGMVRWMYETIWSSGRSTSHIIAESADLLFSQHACRYSHKNFLPVSF